MNKLRNNPGQSARDIADWYYLKRAGIVIVGLLGIYLCLILLPKYSGNSIVVPLAFLVVMKIIVSLTNSKAKSYRKQERKAERGAKAEVKVEDVLRGLQGEHDIFHDVDTGHGDIDHIILSRDHGVFLIETKSHYGEVTVEDGILLIDGRPPEKDFIAQTHRNLAWLKQQLKATTGQDVWIQPIIVFTRAFVKERKPVRGILLRNHKYLIEAITKSKSNQRVNERLWELHERGEALWYCA